MKRRRLTLLLTGLVIMLATAGMIYRLHSQQKLGKPGVLLAKADTATGFEVALPEKVLDYTSEKQGPLPEELGMLPKDTTFGRRSYRAPDGFQVDIAVVVMGADRTSIHRPEFCLTGQGWKIDASHSGVETLEVAGDRQKSLELNRMILDKNLPQPDGSMVPARGMYLYWFSADGRETPRQWQRMWWMAGDLIRHGTLQRWAYIAYFARCHPGQEDAALDRLRKFIAASAPQFQVTLGAGENALSGLRNGPASTMLSQNTEAER